MHQRLITITTTYEVQDRLVKSIIFSKFDQHSEYWQVPVNLADRETRRCYATSKNQAPCSSTWTNHPIHKYYIQCIITTI